MSRINTNVNSLVAQRVLSKNNKQLNTSLERLSTGLKINSGADNPAGLIASENLRAEQTGIKAALSNAERAGNVIATAEGGLAEVSSLLNELQGLVSEAANTGGLSDEEIGANQIQVDSILSTINRLSGSVNFQGKKLLDGSLDYTRTGADLGSKVTNLRVNSSKLTAGASKQVDVAVTAVAEKAAYTLATADVPVAAAGAYTLEVAGNKGTEQVSLAAGATAAQIVAAVNAVKDQTGVEADATGGVRFQSAKFGADERVSVKSVSGTPNISGSDSGLDASVTVNGAKAEVDGLAVSFRNSALDVSFDLTTTANVAGTSTFNITGGGTNFSLSSKVTDAGRESIGVGSISTGSLGVSGASLSSLGNGGTNSLSSANLTKAQEVIDGAIKQVSETRGRLGSFQKFTIGSTVNQLGVALENAAAAESAIRDTDFASETAALTRAQILSQASTNVLSQANSQPQLALQLLG